MSIRSLDSGRWDVLARLGRKARVYPNPIPWYGDGKFSSYRGPSSRTSRKTRECSEKRKYFPRVNIYYKEVGEIACFNHDLTIDAPPVANLIATLGRAIKLQ